VVCYKNNACIVLKLLYNCLHGVQQREGNKSMKMLTKKEIALIPMGYTRDAMGKVLTYKDSSGYWHEYTWDAMGNILTYKDSHGVWREYTRDAFGNILTYKDIHGVWSEYTRDAMGKVLTYNDNHRVWTKIAESEYTLRVDGFKVWAGCRHFLRFLRRL
jgi:YD repeat-containing protein